MFVENQEKFLSGTFEKPLMDALDSEIVDHMKVISKISVARIYNAPTVVQIEIAGFKVMNALLEEFVPAYLKSNKSMFDKKLVAMIPEQFHTNNDDTYSKIRAVLDFVSGMTDVYAVELYRKIQGISIASLE
ncbi:Deoxyguanosinetriphosphate triphosphohydrolase [Mycobacterium tuberculosis]|nr:Deoxyguanosinetriphosphate triphosphohydrolase [Mycobacterium tuberculosis]